MEILQGDIASVVLDQRFVGLHIVPVEPIHGLYQVVAMLQLGPENMRDVALTTPKKSGKAFADYSKLAEDLELKSSKVTVGFNV